ncbi:MAG: beta-N-acetylglucosaminidase domain-containing protein [Clostridium sp.]|nr:beta-N-acetylglucosaminidase domain-containing protein [Clostridium sp.]
MRIKTLASLGLLTGTLGTATAQTVTISPLPQSIEWGAKAFDKTASFTLTGEETADAEAVNVLKSHFTTTGGNVEIVIGERGDEAVASYESFIPEKSEGYYLKVEPGKVVIAGNDGQGTFYGVQSFLQVAGQPEVMSVTVSDYPDVAERGVVEGFYGNNWSQTDRIRQFEFYGANKMNVYIYGPKDDPYHRSKWRENYPADKAQQMKELVAAAQRNKVNFVWALHPGVSIKWNNADSLNVVNKLESMYELGVRSFAIFFDDISGEGARGEKQAQLLNYVTDEFVKKHDDIQPLIMCPTEYNRGWSGNTYHFELRDNMYEDVRIMWTGNSVVDFINKSDLEYINPRIGRKAYIWLNYPVTDYCGRHLLMGPTFGNDLDIADMVSGYTSNPMEYAEASKVSLYSIADYTWNMSQYDSNASWERAIRYLMPEHADAFKLFCENNVDLGTNTHGLRRTNESPAFKALVDRYTATLDEGYNAEAIAAFNAEFERMIQASDELLANTDQPELTAEITPWVQVMKIISQRGKLVMNLFAHMNDDNKEAFIEDYLKIAELEQAQKAVMSRDFDGSIMKVNPAVAEVVVEPFIKKYQAILIQEYKHKYDYRLDVFPAVLLEDGSYYIMYNGKYLSNPNAGTVGGNPVFQADKDLINPTRQEWTISWDLETERYKIVNVKDNRYINENGAFSAGDNNPYEAVWHTYNMYRMNGRYAIQNAGRSGNKFWAANDTRINQGASNAIEYSNFIFEIVPTEGPVNHPVIIENEMYYILDENGNVLTNTNPNKSGGTPTFKTRESDVIRSQVWKFSIDASTGRFKLVSASDNRYVNELGNFGTNSYDATWNTYTMTEFDGRFSIQNAGEAGTNYWYVDGNRISKKSMERNESYLFRIEHYTHFTGINTATEKNSAIGLQAENGKLTVKSEAPVKSITVSSIDGKLMTECKNASELDINGMARGTYVVDIQCANGQKRTAKILLP